MSAWILIVTITLNGYQPDVFHAGAPYMFTTQAECNTQAALGNRLGPPTHDRMHYSCVQIESQLGVQIKVTK